MNGSQLSEKSCSRRCVLQSRSADTIDSLLSLVSSLLAAWRALVFPQPIRYHLALCRGRWISWIFLTWCFVHVLRTHWRSVPGFVGIGEKGEKGTCGLRAGMYASCSIGSAHWMFSEEWVPVFHQGNLCLTRSSVLQTCPDCRRMAQLPKDWAVREVHTLSEIEQLRAEHYGRYTQSRA